MGKVQIFIQTFHSLEQVVCTGLLSRLTTTSMPCYILGSPREDKVSALKGERGHLPIGGCLSQQVLSLHRHLSHQLILVEGRLAFDSEASRISILSDLDMVEYHHSRKIPVYICSSKIFSINLGGVIFWDRILWVLPLDSVGRHPTLKKTKQSQMWVVFSLAWFKYLEVDICTYAWLSLYSITCVIYGFVCHFIFIFLPYYSSTYFGYWECGFDCWCHNFFLRKWNWMFKRMKELEPLIGSVVARVQSHRPNKMSMFLGNKKLIKWCYY